MHRTIVFVVLICFCAATSLRSQGLPDSAIGQESTRVLSVDVALVNVTATVLDESGRYVDALTAADFRVFENGREQKISFFSHDSQIPISLGLLIDTSGSLQDKLRQGLLTLRSIAAALSSSDEMFVITFDSHINLKQRFTNDPEEMQRSLGDVHAHGETAVYDAIAAGLREMKTAKYRKRILLLVTDGFDTRSRISAAQVEELVKRSNVLLYAIGIDDGDTDASIRRRPRYRIYDYMLSGLTSAGSGRLIRLYTGRNYDLRDLSGLILGELHQEYTMGYYPATGRGSGDWRDIEVRTTKPGLQILSHH
jgi:Ca-activated chloride channel family protein